MRTLTSVRRQGTPDAFGNLLQETVNGDPWFEARDFYWWGELDERPYPTFPEKDTVLLRREYRDALWLVQDHQVTEMFVETASGNGHVLALYRLNDEFVKEHLASGLDWLHNKVREGTNPYASRFNQLVRKNYRDRDPLDALDDWEEAIRTV